MVDLMELVDHLSSVLQARPDTGISILIEASNGLTDLLEARGEYTMEEVTVKRWILGDGGREGNCEDCVENADEGWIEESEFFPAGADPVDEPPLHPNCTCGIEYRDTVQRVYA